jgi:DNA processing protein
MSATDHQKDGDACNSGRLQAEPASMHATTTVSAAALGLSGDRTWLLLGDLPPAPRLAVVGSRAASRGLLAGVPEVVAAAGTRGFALVSGGARGVDGAVHRAALAGGVPQLAILPCGPDALYPPEHTALFAAIAAAPGSGLLFAQPPGGARSRGMFSSRNALVVAAASALLVVEAQLRSGSWGTGRQALHKQVPTAAIAASSGCAALIAAGARALSAGTDVGAWLDDLAADRPAPARHWPEELAWLAAALARAGPRGLGLDDLDDPATACAALLTAELAGLVIESPPGRYHARS